MNQSRAVFLSIALLVPALLATPMVTAQEPEFILLGEDAVNDSTLGPQNHPDTASDVVALAVRTDGDNVIFRMDLTGGTTEAGQFCYFPAFEFNGAEYLAMSCFEMFLLGDDQTVSTVVAPSTSRGENVDHSAEIVGNSVFFTIPFAGFGAAEGDSLDDIYGMVYTSRGRLVTDNIPDAKSDVDSAESLGSYVIGTTPGGPEILDEVMSVFQNLTEPSFMHSFENATSDLYTVNFTVPWQNITLDQYAGIHTGSANVTVLRDGEVLSSFVLNNETSPVMAEASQNATEEQGNATAESTGNETTEAPPTDDTALLNMAGNWSVVIAYDNFVGSLGMTIAEYAPAEPVTIGATNETAEPVLEANEDAPGPALPLVALGLLAVVAVARRSRD